MRPSFASLRRVDEPTALERRHHAGRGRPADPHRGREVARLHLAPHPQHPEAHERRPREPVGREDLRLHVAADRGGAAEHVRDRPHRAEVERQVRRARRRSSARAGSRAVSAAGSGSSLTRRSPRGRSARPARARRRAARARRPRWCGSSRSTVGARPRRRSAPTRGRRARRPGSPSASAWLCAFGSATPGGTWRIGTIDSCGGASITSKSSVSLRVPVEELGLREVAGDRVAELRRAVRAEREPQLQRAERPRVLERDVDRVQLVLLVRQVALLVRERARERVGVLREHDAARLRQVEPLVGVDRAGVGALEPGEVRRRATRRRPPAARRRRRRAATRRAPRRRRRSRRSGRSRP